MPSQLTSQANATALRAWVFATLLALAGCATTSQPIVLNGEGLGATWSVKLAEPPAHSNEEIRTGVQQRVDEVARQLSRWDAQSSLGQLNNSKTQDWQPLPPTLFSALSFALRLAPDTGGAYDPTVAPLVDAWGFGIAGRRFDPPATEAIEAAQKRVGWAKVELDESMQRVRRPSGMQIDLSSMTHGLAADEVAIYLRSRGIDRYFIDVGSEIRAAGLSHQNQAWRVGVERPPEEASSDGVQSTPLRVVALRDAGIATSGNYRYYFDFGGRRYSHRLDPRTGAPITHPLASVTVIDPQCAHADALATALTVLGPDEGLDYARRHDIAALFVVRTPQGVEERMTPQFAAYLD